MARRTPHAYLPVYERSPRYVIGVIRVDELLLDDDWSVVADRIRPVTRFAPRVTVAEAITAMQDAGHPLATVTDHGGRMIGLVTMKDLLEGIVGDSPTS
jgi:putative hemolysin